MNARLALVPMTLLLILACRGNSSSEIIKQAGSKWVMGYYVGYLADRQSVAAIDWNGLTHLAVGIVLPKADGSLDMSIAFDATKRAEIIKTGHDKGRKVIAMIGGENTGPQWLEASSKNRGAFISSLKKLVNEEGFDGLDLDWEPLETVQQPELLSLTKELRAALPNAILTFPADGADNANFPADRKFYAELAPYLDQINAMTWKTWHSSALFASGDGAAPTSVELAVNGYLKAGVPAAKLGIGIGFYGQCYSAPATKPLEDTVGIRPEGAKMVAGDNDLSYANIVTQYEPFGTKNWDSKARVPYLSFPLPNGVKGCTYLTYENEQSIFEKAAFAKAKGLGGAIIWNINEGYIPGATPANPLLDAIRRSFLQP
jgi:chitinase